MFLAGKTGELMMGGDGACTPAAHILLGFLFGAKCIERKDRQRLYTYFLSGITTTIDRWESLQITIHLVRKYRGQGRLVFAYVF